MEKVTRRTVKRWSGKDPTINSNFGKSKFCLEEFAQDHSELGAALNGFSLNETGELSSAIEKTGQAIDVTYISTTKLVSMVCIFISFHLRIIRFKNLSKTGQNLFTNTHSSPPLSRSYSRIVIKNTYNTK